MLGKHFRPWGHFSWVFNKIPDNKWDLFGCLSTERRCISALSLVRDRNQLNQMRFLQIKDPSPKYSVLANSKLEEQLREFTSLGGSKDNIEDHELLEKHSKLVESVNGFIKCSNGNVIIDISSFPKRFFFPILRLLIGAPSITNLIATYTVPKTYSEGELAEDPQTWLTLPLFGVQTYPEPNVDVAIVGVGFLPFGLPELLKNEYSNASVRLFFPFPPGPPTYQRSWKFVRQIEHYQSSNQLIRVNALDVSGTFEHICVETNSGSKNAIFAPYGPKPLSLAMCIYAALANAPVYYTQPRIYNPNYSTGVKTVNGVPETYAYCLRLGGKNFYSI